MSKHDIEIIKGHEYDDQEVDQRAVDNHQYALEEMGAGCPHSGGIVNAEYDKANDATKLAMGGHKPKRRAELAVLDAKGLISGKKNGITVVLALDEGAELDPDQAFLILSTILQEKPTEKYNVEGSN